MNPEAGILKSMFCIYISKHKLYDALRKNSNMCTVYTIDKEVGIILMKYNILTKYSYVDR